MSGSFGDSLAALRPELLRHCYRMLGSFHDAEEVVQDALANAWKARASYEGAVPLRHWLMRIATNACLNARRASRSRRNHQDQAASAGTASIGAPLDPEDWVTAAPDAALFGPAGPSDSAHLLETRETVALAFVELLQTLPARQRATLLLKDVVGFSVEEIATALDMSEAAVASALHRGRSTMSQTGAARLRDERDPPAEVLRAYIRCWETRDVEGLLALLREDVILAMPPWAIWFRGRDAVRDFVTTERFLAFWGSGLRVEPTRANGGTAVLFYRDGGRTPHSVQVLGFDGQRFTRMSNLIGPTFLRGFEERRPTTERSFEAAVSS